MWHQASNIVRGHDKTMVHFANRRGQKPHLGYVAYAGSPAFRTHMHVLLLVLDAGQRAGEFPDHVLQLGVAHLLLAGSAWGALWGLSHVNGEHDQLGRHAAALVVEAHGVGTLGGGHEGVLAGGLLLAFVHHMVLGAADLDVHVQEAAVNHLKGDACKGVIVLSVI